MADWRFASKEGYLTWSTSDDPEEQYLYSELSPTLIVGHQQKGDVFPVDYIKITSISKTIRRNAVTLELVKKGDLPSNIVIAPTPEEAEEWYNAITLALTEQNYDSTTSVQSSKNLRNIYTSSVNPIGYSVNNSQHSSHQLQSPFCGYVQPTPTPANQYSFSDAHKRNTIMEDRISAPLSERYDNNTAVEASSVASSKSALLYNADKQLPSWSGTPAEIQVQPSSKRSSSFTAAKVGNPNTNPLWKSSVVSSHISSSANEQAFKPQQKHVIVGTSTTTTYGEHSVKSNSHFFSKQPANTQNIFFGGESIEKTFSVPSESHFDNRKHQMGSQQKSHQSDLKFQRNYNNTYNSKQLTPITHSSPLGHVHSSFDVLKASRTISTPSVNNMMRDYSESALPGRDSSNRPQVNHLSEQLRPSSEYQAINLNTNHGVRKRSGMFVTVPPNLHHNRNISPNVSAMWKEWSDPEGVLHVLHEPTQTLYKKMPGATDFSVVHGNGDILVHDFPYSLDFDQVRDTTCNMNENVVRNVYKYGAQKFDRDIGAAHVGYRADNVMSPRGPYSPSRRSRVSQLAYPQKENRSEYEGNRIHQLVLSSNPNSPESTLTHQIISLASHDMPRNQNTGKDIAIRDKSSPNLRSAGHTTLQKQWEEVRHILLKGKCFKKHALKRMSTSYSFVFLTGDNAYVVCIPASELSLNVHTDPRVFKSVQDTVKYYGPTSRAIALNSVTRVTIGTDENFVAQRSGIVPENTFCIVSRTHAFIFECSSAEEARYYADAWRFFLYHSKPLQPGNTKSPHMKQPITHGTRSGVAF